MKKFNLAILISGGGSNMEAILKYFSQKRNSKLDIKVVISDQKNALGLKKAEKYSIESIYLNPGNYRTKLTGEAEDNYINFLVRKEINLICLAGFMRVLKKKIITRFPKQIINIHPSLLPKYPGLNTHERALKNKEKETGCTVHLIDYGIDTGPIIRQRKIKIEPSDNVKSLNQKVIQQEHLIYSQVIEDIVNNKINLKNT